MSSKRPAGTEGFSLGDTTQQGRETDIPPEGTSVDPEEGAGEYHATKAYITNPSEAQPFGVRGLGTIVVPRAAVGPVAETSFIDDAEGPPPSYESAIGGYRVLPQDEEAQNPSSRRAAPIAVGESDALSPDEVAMVLKMQDQRRDYMPKTPEKFDGEEEMKMEKRTNGSTLNPENFGADSDGSGDEYRDEVVNSARPRPTPREAFEDTLQPVSAQGLGSVNAHSMELGEARDDRSDGECSGYGPLDIPLTRVSRFLKNLSGTRLIIAVIVLVALMGLVVFLGVFPASFVYVEYHEIALKQSKMTNSLDRGTVYYSGCYVLGPDTKFVKFPATAQHIDMTMSVFTLDTISITISFSIQYFLRPEEIGQLHADYAMEYEDVFRKLIESSLKNLAGTSITVDDFRFNRTFVEIEMHTLLQQKLGGDCCPLCCPKNCHTNKFCRLCVSGGDCNQGYHIDVRIFSLKTVRIPDEVFEKYLHSTILGINAEKEFLLQNHTLIEKETEKETKRLKNEAKEIRWKAYANSAKIKTVSEADYEKQVQYSYASAWKALFSNLSVTQEDHKLSLMMIKAFDEVGDNLYFGTDYEKNTLFGN